MRVPFVRWNIDERFLMHRLRSTSIGGIAGVLVAYALFLYDLLGKKHVFRWDLLAVVATAAIVKIALLLWYHFTD